MNILLIEDEHDVASFIIKGLEEQNYNVAHAANGNIGLSIALTQGFDLIILDVLLPGINGIDICKTIRSANISTPIIILTALGGINDKINGLENGADDYITKPFHFDELTTRIKVLIRRQNSAAADKTYVVGSLTLNCNSRTVLRNNEKIILTTKEFSLLELLMANKNRILSRSTIAKTIWGANFDKGSNLIDVYINFLRKKIDKGNDKKLIQTIIGMGYVIRD